MAVRAITFNVAGTSFRKAARYVLGGTKVKFKPDYFNPYDDNAVKVYAFTHKKGTEKKLRWIGYVPKAESEMVRELLRKKRVVSCRIGEFTLREIQGKVYPSIKLNMRVRI